MLLAELNIRHTRRHMPTRRVAVDHGYLPTSGAAFGGVLIGAVVAECVPGLDEEQTDALARLVDVAKRGSSPCPASRSATACSATPTASTCRVTASPAPRSSRIAAARPRARPARPAGAQVIGALMAASQLPASGRSVAFRFVDAALARPGVLPEGLEVRRRYHGLPGMRPPGPAPPPRSGRGRADGPRRLGGVPSERRWAMEVLGLQAGHAIERDDVQRRFRRLVRLAHPDHGGESVGAAERMAELSEAREVLLSVITDDDADSASAGSGTGR